MDTVRAKEAKGTFLVGIHIRRSGYDYHLQMTQKGRLVDSEWHYRAMRLLKNQLQEKQGNEGSSLGTPVNILKAKKVQVNNASLPCS